MKEFNKHPAEIMMRLMDDMDIHILVTDPETDVILFANQKMNKTYGVMEDPTGKVCWKIYNTDDGKRCRFCPLDQLVKNPTGKYVWEMKNELAHRWFRNTDTMIPWEGGKLVHLQQGVDITSAKEFETTMNQRLNEQTFLNEMTGAMGGNGDLGQLMTEAVEKVGQYLNADHVLLGPWNKKTGQGEYCYRWDRHPVAQGESLYTYALREGMREYGAFVQDRKQYLAVADTSTRPDSAHLRDAGIRAVLRVPIWEESKLWGLLDIVMDESGKRKWSDGDIHVAYVLATVMGGAIARNQIKQELIRAKEYAETSSYAKSEFLARVSHEMRTPMNVIMGMTSIAGNAEDMERMRYCIDKIGIASTHLQGIINDMLDMSKLESGHLQLALADVLLTAMLKKIKDIVGFRFEQKRQHFEIQVDDGVPSVIVTDRHRLSQVIVNLLLNASKFTEEGGHISLRISEGKEDGQTDEQGVVLRFAIEDDGIGMSPEQVKSLFSSFMQVDGSTSRRYGGAGLGLAISKRIINAMGGEIGVYSKQNEGSEFFFTVRVGKGSTRKIAKVRSSRDAINRHVLLVDESLDARERFEDIALTFGIVCTAAATVREAQMYLDKEETFDMMFVDWKTLGEKGAEQVRLLRRRFATGCLVVIATQQEREDISARVLRAGADSFLEKPLIPSDFVNCVNKCFGTQIKHEAVGANRTGRMRMDDKCLLLVEDVAMNREILMVMLEDTGVHIECAEDGQQAFDMFAAAPERYDMIFMDIHMPGVDGYQATRMIRAFNHPMAGKIPIVAMTANVFREDVERCLEVGMNDHIGKPIDVELVMDKMQQYMGDGRRDAL